MDKVVRILSNRAAVLLLCVFIGANFVAAAFLTWLPTFIYRKFGMGLSGSSTDLDGLAAGQPGRRALRGRAGRLGGRGTGKGGRIRVQSLGLILGAPFVFLAGWSDSFSMLVASLVAAGLCKGIYDANIFASLFDVVRPEDRGTAAGLMNSVGWTGGFLAPVAVGLGSKHFGLGVAIASTAARLPARWASWPWPRPAWPSVRPAPRVRSDETAHTIFDGQGFELVSMRIGPTTCRSGTATTGCTEAT